MKQAQGMVLAVVLLFLSGSVYGQEPFQNCAAAFLDGRMVVNEYSPEGKCVLTAKASGELVVGTVDLSETGGRLVDPISFKVAIRDGNSKTMVLYSSQTYRKIPVEKVLASCRPGDSIVLLTLENRYALPHNEILVN
jgi:hypothetical protein